MKLVYKLLLFDQQSSLDTIPQHNIGNRFEEANESAVSLDLKAANLNLDLLANMPRTVDLGACFDIYNLKAVLIKADSSVSITITRGAEVLVKANSNLLFLNKESITNLPVDPNQPMQLELLSLVNTKTYVYTAGV